MELQPVESSMISAAGYDKPTRTLQVQFTSGKSYIYFHVPKWAFKKLMAAESKGRYMREGIIGCYSCAELSSPQKRR